MKGLQRTCAYLCFGTLHAPHCATQVFVCLAERLPRVFSRKKPGPYRTFWQRGRAKSATQISGKTRDPKHAKFETCAPPKDSDARNGLARYHVKTREGRVASLSSRDVGPLPRCIVEGCGQQKLHSTI